MRFSIAIALLAVGSATAFSPSFPKQKSWGASLRSAVSENADATTEQPATPTASKINARMEELQKKMELKDKASTELTKENLEIIYQDNDIIAVNKPAGILSVPGKTDNPSLNKAVFDAVGCDMGRMDMMVVHRLGMDTSGVMVFAKTKTALKNMNKLFRNRAVSRAYEALVVGHVDQDEGFIDLPLIRDYENAPYMRVSTASHQFVLAEFTSDDVHKKLLDPPKDSMTKYEVTSREELNGHPVSRVTLTSITGRTHQLSVHCAAFGHPIVGDKSYGVGGDAAPNGGLSVEEMESLAPNSQRASVELQEQVMAAAADSGIKNMCVHAKSISFKHPVTKEPMSFSSEAPF